MGRISIETEQAAYPFTEQYYPIARIFNAPYEVGDCPIETVQFDALDEDEYGNAWVVSSTETSSGDYKTYISDIEVYLFLDYDTYIDGNSYEVRIYPSDIAVESASA